MGTTSHGRTNGKLGTSAKERRDSQDRSARLDIRKMAYMPVVIDAEYISDYKIRVTFDNGEERVADLAGKLNRGVFLPLKDKKYFKKFFVDGWTISWPNGADIAPETLYEDSEPD